MEERVFL